MSYVEFRQEGRIAHVALNRPERLNAIGDQLLADFDQALRQAIAAAGVDVIVLSGKGRAFCAGDDLKELDLAQVNEAGVREHVRRIQGITRHLMGTDKPVVGAIHGYAVGGGFEWLLNCDIVVASDDLVAFFPEMQWGFFVTGGVTHLLPQAVGHQKAMEWLLLGERLGADTLRAHGLVSRVVPVGDVLPTAAALAERIAAQSRPSVARLKTMLTGDLGHTLWSAVELEEQATIEAFLRPDARERSSRYAR